MPIDQQQLAAGVATAVNAGSALANASMGKHTRKWNEMMYEKQRLDALKDWESTNAYNSPEAQMARLKKAGLNPNLVYGNGATAEGGNIRGTEMKSWNPAPIHQDTSGLSMMYDLSMKNAQMSNMEAQRKVLEMDALLRASQVIQTNQGTEVSKFDLQQKDRLKDVAYQKAVLDMNLTDANRHRTWQGADLDLNKDEREAALNSSNLREASERILRMRSQNATDAKQRAHIDSQIKSLGNSTKIQDYEIELNRLGVQKGDPVWLRLFMQLLNEL